MARFTYWCFLIPLFPVLCLCFILTCYCCVCSSQWSHLRSVIGRVQARKFYVFIYLLIEPVYKFTHIFIYLFTFDLFIGLCSMNSVICLLALIYLLIYLFIYLFTYLFIIYLFAYLFIYLFIYLYLLEVLPYLCVIKIKI